MIPLNTLSLAIVNAHFEFVVERLEKSITYVLKNGCRHKGSKYTEVGNERIFLNSLKRRTNLKRLITASPKELEILRRFMLIRFPNIHSNNDNLNRLLYKIFVSDGYGAIDNHAFIANLKVDTCPYCNRNL